MKRSEIEVVDFGCPLRPCFPLFSPVSPFQSGSAGAGTLPGEAYACNHPRCRQQPRPDAVPPRFRDRCYPCRRKSRSRIIRYGVIRASVLGCTPRAWHRPAARFPARRSTQAAAQRRCVGESSAQTPTYSKFRLFPLVALGAAKADAEIIGRAARGIGHVGAAGASLYVVESIPAAVPV